MVCWYFLSLKRLLRQRRWHLFSFRLDILFESSACMKSPKYRWRFTAHEMPQSWRLVFSTHYESTPIQIYRKFHLQNLKIFRYKNSDIFHISAQNIDCGYSLEPPRRGGSNEYSQSIFLNRNKKNHIYPYKPQFYYTEMGFKGSKVYRHVFVMTPKEWEMRNK